MTKITFADEEHPRPSTKASTYKRRSQRGGSPKPVDSTSQTPDYAATTVSSTPESVPLWESLSFKKECWLGTCEHDAETIIDMPADDFLNHLGSGASISRLEEFEEAIHRSKDMSGLKTRANEVQLTIIRHLKAFKTSGNLDPYNRPPNHVTAIAALRREELEADGEEKRGTNTYDRTAPIISAIFVDSEKGTEVVTFQTDAMENESWEYVLGDSNKQWQDLETSQRF